MTTTEKDLTKLEVRVNLVKKEDSKIKAYASIRANVPLIGPMALNHIKIVAGSKGIFVSMPSQKKEQDGGDVEYFDHFHPVTAEGRDAINTLVLEAYELKLASV